MKKFIVGILLVMLLLLLVVPGAVGLVAENEFRKLSSNVETNAPGLRWEVVDYQRGWFRSHARYRLVFSHPAIQEALHEQNRGMEALPHVVNEADIYHGPIAFVALGRAGVSMLPMIAHSVDKPAIEFGDGRVYELPGKVSTRLNLIGSNLNRIHMDPLKNTFIEDGKNVTIIWDGMDMRTRFSSDLGTLDIDGDIRALELVSDEFRATIEPMRLDVRQQRSEYGLWTGDGRLNWQGIQLESSKESRPFQLTIVDLGSDGSVSIADGMVSQDAVITLSEVAVGGWQGGPGKLSIGLEKLDARAMGELSQAATALSMGGVEQSAPTMSLFFPHIQALLAGGPVVRLRELSFGTPDGVVSFTAKLVFPESTPEAAFGFILGLDGTAHLRVPQALMESMTGVSPESGAQLQSLLDAGFLIRKDGNLVLDAALRGGLLTVNGQPIPIPLGF